MSSPNGIPPRLRCDLASTGSYGSSPKSSPSKSSSSAA